MPSSLLWVTLTPTPGELMPHFGCTKAFLRVRGSHPQVSVSPVLMSLCYALCDLMPGDLKTLSW